VTKAHIGLWRLNRENQCFRSQAEPTWGSGVGVMPGGGGEVPGKKWSLTEGAVGSLRASLNAGWGKKLKTSIPADTAWGQMTEMARLPSLCPYTPETGIRKRLGIT